MKERVQFHIDKFIDKNGNERHFVLCGLSQEFEGRTINNNSLIENHTWHYLVGNPAIFYDKLTKTALNICKCLKLGYAICNPNDKFNEELGMTIAEGRARKNKEYALFATKPGYINTDTVGALLEREAEFFKKNPEMYIKGYERMVKN